MSKTPIHALKYIAELEAERDRLAGYIDRAEDSIFAAMAPSGWGRSTHEHHASRVTTLSNLYLGLAAENAPLRKALQEIFNRSRNGRVGYDSDMDQTHEQLQAKRLRRYKSERNLEQENALLREALQEISETYGRGPTITPEEFRAMAKAALARIPEATKP